MDWNMKIPPWMLAELNQETEQRILSLIGSSSGLQQQASRVGCSVDLKLGGFGDFGSLNQSKDQKMRASTTMVTSSGASRRSRAQSSSGQIASCSVDGCAVDLSKCREYHRRHKVCELHSKTPIVVVGGQEQRFCQQCSRFQTLSEFDEGKRSCRKRLDGHNKRRRKPQLDSLNPGNLPTNYQGTRFSQDSKIRAATTTDPNWANFSLKSEHAAVYAHRLPSQFPFLQESEEALNSDHALSLLSSSAQSSHINMSPMMSSADKIPIAQPLQHCDSMEPYPCFQTPSCVSMAAVSCVPMEDENVGSNLVSDANYTNLHSQVLFQGGSKESIQGISGTPAIHWQW